LFQDRRRAEAERQRRAKVIHADGEFHASQKLAEAAAVISTQPGAMHLRFSQSLVRVAAENNSTAVLPIPVDLVTPNRTPGKKNYRHTVDTGASHLSGSERYRQKPTWRGAGCVVTPAKL
jgi:hypothetical protein